MIRYSLKCEAGHGFESWFKEAGAFPALQAAGQVQCPVCGSSVVEKELMAPAVRPARKSEGGARPDLPEPATETEERLGGLWRQIEENSE